MNLRKWVNNCLFNLFGLSEEYLIDFFLNIPKTTNNKEKFLKKLKNNGIIKVNTKTRAFISELWKKVMNIKIDQNKIFLERVNDEDKKNEKRKKKKKIVEKRKISKKIETNSLITSDDIQTKIKRWNLETFPRKNKMSKEEFSNMKRLNDLKEKQNLEKRIEKREIKNKKIIIDNMNVEERIIHNKNKHRKAISEMTLNEIKLEIENARNTSRHEYLKKRQEDIIELLRREIEWEEFTFGEEYRTNEEKIKLKMKKKMLELAEKVTENMNQREEGYIMPTSSQFIVRNKTNDLQQRYYSEKEIKTDQLSWESSKVAATQGQIKSCQFRQGKWDLILENQEEMIKFELASGFNPQLKIEENTSNGFNVREKIKLKLFQQRKTLPIFPFRKAILSAIYEHQIIIIVAETGSGKTTQIPQYLIEAGYGSDGQRIAITQPRRIAAMSVAKRVSDEMGVSLGQQVGYTIRFEDKTSEYTILKYLTDGMLLKEFLMQPDLKGYSAVIIDEAHERTLHTDILFGLVKDVTRVRNDLKLIISSATLDAEKFSEYFDDAPIFRVPGRKFTVDVYHTQTPESDYIYATIVTIMQIHVTQKSGDILVFLNGQSEIEAVEASLAEKVTKLGKKIKELIILSIYANLPAERQILVFQPTPPIARKVVLATNIAETSLTIDGIVFVIDPGFHKQNIYHPRTGMEALLITPISKASADQRKGRAGRVAPGKCFRLYTQHAFQEMKENTVPEIQRTNLSNVVLMMKSLGINDFVNFDFMDSPPAETLIKALEHLYALNALNHKGELTKLGRRMAEFPLDPQLSKTLVESEKYECSSEILTMASMLSSNSSLFVRPKEQISAADVAHRNFWGEFGDHFTLLNVYNQWVESNYSKEWCKACFIQWRSLKRARDIRKQIEGLMERVEIMPTSSEDNIKIRKAILSGFFYNSARLDKIGIYKTTKSRVQVEIHPGSCLFYKEQKPKIIMFFELVFTTKEYMRTCTTIDPDWLFEVAPHYFQQTEVQKIKEKSKNKDKNI